MLPVADTLLNRHGRPTAEAVATIGHGDEWVLASLDEAGVGEPLDGGAAELGLKGPVEALAGPADLDAAAGGW